MSGFTGSNWHTANGGGLPIRPPTVDEALPYSPFTSIVPFSPELIPYPSTEPPTPPTTLTQEQQSAAKKTLDILNDEVRSGSHGQHLQSIFPELQQLLNPNDLSQFKFKPATQLATPPPETPANLATNGFIPSRTSNLSPFANMLLKNTNVSFVHPSLQQAKRSEQSRVPSTQPSSQSGDLSRPEAHATPPIHASNSSGLVSQHHSTTTISAPNSAPSRPGVAISIIPKPLGAPREEYQRYDASKSSKSRPKAEDTRKHHITPAMKSQEREIADRKMDELCSLTNDIHSERDNADQSRYFVNVSTDDGELSVLELATMDKLTEAVSRVVNTGCFPELSVEQVLLIQSLCEPVITATRQMSLYLSGGDSQDFLDRLRRAEAGLRACKLVLQTMTEGCDDRQLCSEDLVTSIIKLLKNVLDSSIIPLIECRRTGSASELFNLATEHKLDIHPVLRLCGTVLSQMTTLIGKINLTVMALSPVESVAIGIIFAQIAEKDSASVIETQRFETFRQRAMDVLAQIFACHADQRDSITNDVLSNLEKLPSERSQARQYKSRREPPIMLVSALFMRLVQAGASKNIEEEDISASEQEDDSQESDSEPEYQTSKKSKVKPRLGQNPRQVIAMLWNEAMRTATHVARYLVDRATNVSKSGDKPFRKILDLAIEDFVNVLGAPTWPAASLLLEQLLALMVSMSVNVKDKGVQAVDMAISTMGVMGCGIIDFRQRLKHLKRGIDISQSDLASRLVPLIEDALNSNININDVLALRGPYRVLVESLPSFLNPHGKRVSPDDAYLQSLTGFYTTSWANTFYHTLNPETADEPQAQSIKDLEAHMKKMVADSKWLSKEYNLLQDVKDVESQLAAGIITLQERFCKYLPKLVTQLLSNTQSHSAKIKQKSIASLSQLNEKDPEIVDERTFRYLVEFLKDSSPAVRIDTLSLISRCLERDAALERWCLPSILNVMKDPANGPKKKAIKLLKDIYLATATREKKIGIATELLLPVLDDDKGIAELTRQTLEDIWLFLHSTSGADESRVKLSREQRVSLLVDTVQNIQGKPTQLKALEMFFTEALSAQAKNSIENLKICKVLVADMVEAVISPESATGNKSQTRILQTMSILAKVCPKLFTADQVQLFKVYVMKDFKPEELGIFRSTVVIFRFVLPSLPSLQESFLEVVRHNLMGASSRLASFATQGHVAYKETLLDVAHCLWIISPRVVGNPPLVRSGLEKLMIMLASLTTQVQPLSAQPITQSDTEQATDKKTKDKIISLLTLMGVFGKACDLDTQVDLFKAQFRQAIAKKKPANSQSDSLSNWNGVSVAVLFLDTIIPFTKQAWDPNIRQQALCSMGEVCQQTTRHFTRADIEKAFKLPFVNQDDALMRVALMQFRDFFAAAERRSESGAEIAVGEGAVHGSERLGTSFVASDSDHATAHIAAVFLSTIVQVALGRTDELAYFATDIISSISRQGLVHPKECGAALVALSTSSVPNIAQKASKEHANIHLQHETMFEKEYVSAVTMAFEYQRDVFQDSRGATDGVWKPKMHHLFEAFKQGNKKTLKKFITNLFREMNFELATLNSTGVVPNHVLFARFCLENFAFFDYRALDEIYHILFTIENIVLKQTGPSVALAIETELPEPDFHQQSQVVVIEGVPTDLPPPVPTKVPITDQRLRHLAAASIVLQMMWDVRGHVRRAYNLPAKPPKNIQGPASKMNFVTGKELWERFTSITSALDSPEAMMKQCRDLAEIINVDKEHAVQDEDVDAAEHLAKIAAGYETPNDDEDGELAAPASGRGKKRKSSVLPGSTPKKPRNRASGSKKKRISNTPEEDDWD